jgi:hypothetical protein
MKGQQIRCQMACEKCRHRGEWLPWKRSDETPEQAGRRFGSELKQRCVDGCGIEFVTVVPNEKRPGA